MKTKIGLLPIIVSLIMSTFSPESIADSGAYLGGGLNNLELDGEDSVNISITAGYNLHNWNFESTRIQALSLAIEAQYSDSISGADDVNNYSVFATLRAYTSEHWFLKIKQGFTNFPDLTLRNANAENSHVGAGIGLGYRIHSGSIEVEYIYPNKTVNASLFEISYKYHF